MSEQVESEAEGGKGFKENLVAAWRWLVATYATADPRSLGLFRIALGALLFEDVARRLPDLDAHYTNAGWLKNHFALYRPMSDHLFSLYLAFGPPQEVRVLIGVHLVVCLLLMIGWRTRVMHVLAAVLITSLNSRTIMLENGGWVVLNLLTVWSMFLPTGRRFSVDALLRSWKARREGTAEALNDRTPAPDTHPVASLAVAALILQWTVIYYFNVVQKTGRPWHDGTAVYYFFQQDRMVTPFGVWVRGLMPLMGYKLMTWSALVIESSISILIIAPVATRYTRMIAWLLVCSLHLAIDSVVQLGPFSYAMVTMFFVLIPREAWEALERRVRRKKQPRRLYFDPADGYSISVCRWVKRFDPLALVEFVPTGETGEGDAAPGPLTVTDQSGSTRWTGSSALVHLFDALPLRGLVCWARLPGVRALVDRRIERAVSRREARSAFFRVADLPGASSDPPGGPSGARRMVSRVSHAFGTVLVALLMVAAGSQVLVENAAVPKWLKPKHRPEWMTSMVVYPRLFQGWSMFAPRPPDWDGRMVVDGRTADGRKLDPLTGKAPSFEVQPKGGFRMDQIWGDFHRRIGDARFSAYLGGVRDFLLNDYRLTGHPEDRLVAFDVYYVSQQIPPPGQPRAPVQIRKLLSYGVVADPSVPRQGRPR